MMVKERLSIEDISERLTPFAESHQIKKLILFGSYARGTQTRRSDIDLIIVMNTEKRFFDRYDDVANIYQYLGAAGADILIYTPEELEAISHRPFIATALREGIVIYGN